MDGMPMVKGAMTSMMWIPLPRQTWLGTALSFLGMWIVMMAAMMLPSFVPMLWRYRQSVSTNGEARLAALTALVAVGYLCTWTLIGAVVYLLGATLAALDLRQPMLARAMPIAAGLVVLLAGWLQFTTWKARRLASCKEPPEHGRTLTPRPAAAWRHGLHLGLLCAQSCAGLMAVLLVIGVMNLRAMAVVTIAITIERLAPDGERVARAVGAATVGAGLFLIALAAGVR
jgi:predicted metal-binding membrane protein